MPISFSAAKRNNAKVMLGIAGPSSSGKTYSALLIADGMREVFGGDIFVIDTERGRAKHYASEVAFQWGELAAPFTPDAYLDAIKEAAKAKPTVIIVDSMSHEHEGPGGMLEQHEAELQRMAGDDWKKRERVKFSAWIKPKEAHNRFVNDILQIDAHFIFCFRAKDKLVMVKNAQGRQEPVSAGWTPICSSRFEYEMTATMILPPGAEGRPDFDAEAKKMPTYLTRVFVPGEQLSRDTGKRLAAWARGEAVKEPSGGGARRVASSPEAGGGGGPNNAAAPAVDPDIRAKARKIAQEGMELYRGWYGGLTTDERRAIADDHETNKAIAEEADQQAAKIAEPVR